MFFVRHAVESLSLRRIPVTSIVYSWNSALGKLHMGINNNVMYKVCKLKAKTAKLLTATIEYVAPKNESYADGVINTFISFIINAAQV